LWVLWNLIHFPCKKIKKFYISSWYQNLCLLKVWSSLDSYLVKRRFWLISEVFVLNINHIIHLHKASIFLICSFTLSPIFFPNEIKCLKSSYAILLGLQYLLIVVPLVMIGPSQQWCSGLRHKVNCRPLYHDQKSCLN